MGTKNLIIPIFVTKKKLSVCCPDMVALYYNKVWELHITVSNEFGESNNNI